MKVSLMVTGLVVIGLLCFYKKKEKFTDSSLTIWLNKSKSSLVIKSNTIQDLKDFCYMFNIDFDLNKLSSIEKQFILEIFI